MPTPEPHRLIVMRHAKAEPYADEDESRRLTDAGREAARQAGRWLAERGLVPDHAWVSAAVRTRETWEEVLASSGAGIEPELDPAIYAAGPETLIDLLRLTPRNARTVLLVGHNPTVAYLSHLLDDGHPDPAAWQQVAEGFPTAAMAVFTVPLDWGDLALASAHLSDFHIGGRDV